MRTYRSYIRIHLKVILIVNIKVLGEKEKFNKVVWQKIRAEINQLERIHEQREKELQLINEGLKKEINTLQEIMSNTGNKSKANVNIKSIPVERLISNLKAQIEQQNKDYIRFADKYNQISIQLKEEKKANIELTQEISEHKLKLLTIEEMKKKIKLAEQQATAAEDIALAKIAEMEIEIERVQAEHTLEKKELIENSEQLNKEKVNAELKVEELFKIYNEKIELAEEKVVELTKCTEMLLSKGKEQEENMKTKVLEISKGFISLQEELECNNIQISNQCEDDMKRKNELTKVIEHAIKKLEDGRLKTNLSALCNAHQKDIKILQEQLRIKEDEIKALSNKGGKTVMSILNDSNRSYENFMNEVGEIRLALEHCAANSKRQLESDLLERLIQENNILKKELAFYSENNIEMLKAQLMHTQIELKELKKVAFTNEQINTQNKSQKVNSSSELDRAKVEILRLNAENEALLNENKEMKEYYMNVIGQLEDTLATRSIQLQSISRKL